MTLAEFTKKFNELTEMRGKKHSEVKDSVRYFQALGEIAPRFGPKYEIRVLMYLIASIFELSNRSLEHYMEIRTWRLCYLKLIRVLSLMDQNPNFRLLFEDPETENDVQVLGNPLNILTKLAEEYTKSLQQLNPHSNDYISRLRDEKNLLTIAGLVQEFYEKRNELSAASVAATIRVEHLYYKHNTIAEVVYRFQVFSEEFGDKGSLHPACINATPKNPQEKINVHQLHPASLAGYPKLNDETMPEIEPILKKLCTFVYKNGDERSKIRVMLCHITHHALHNRFAEARDLLLMSHIQKSIVSTDIMTKVLFNRTMAQLGLCAFRNGLMYEAHSCLQDICSNRQRELELLAQNTQSKSEKSPEQEKLEKRRFYPFHMHINTELLQCCHTISAMLLEIPLIAMEKSGFAPLDHKKRVLSKFFRKSLAQVERDRCGPPESNKDHIIYGAKALLQGDWKRCSNLITNLDIWNLFPGKDETKKVKEMLVEKIKIEGLRTYLFAFHQCYESVSLPSLCAIFELEKSMAHSIISKMMINQELYASWDQTTDTIIMHKINPSPMQSLAIKVAEKVVTLVESNERIYNAMEGGYEFKEDWGNKPVRDGANQRTQRTRRTFAVGSFAQRYGQQDRRKTGGGIKSNKTVGVQN